MKRISLLIAAAVIFPMFLFSQSKEKAKVVVQYQGAKSDTINKMGPDNTKTGYWEESNGGDMISKGYYKNNAKTGTWVTTTPNNLLVKLESYNNGRKEGIFLTFDKKNRLISQEWYRNGLLNGLSVSFNAYNENPVSEVNYVNGKRNGLSKLYYENNKVQEEANYKDDQKDGNVTWMSKAGKIVADYNYKNGIFEGVQKTYYENDTLQSYANYHNNLLDGEYYELFRNGKTKISGKYINGEKEGIWTEFDETGKAVKTTRYKAGSTPK
jgi:uncharacterized protein